MSDFPPTGTPSPATADASAPDQASTAGPDVPHDPVPLGTPRSRKRGRSVPTHRTAASTPICARIELDATTFDIQVPTGFPKSVVMGICRRSHVPISAVLIDETPSTLLRKRNPRAKAIVERIFRDFAALERGYIDRPASKG